MKGTRASVRYAKALYQLALEQKLLDKVVVDVKLVASTVEGSKELEGLLKSPLVNAEKKKASLEAIFKGKVQELCLSFIAQLLDQGRENLLYHVCLNFIAHYNQAHQIAEVSVTTASPMDKASKDKLIQSIKEKYNFSSIDLKEKLDESLIGGILLRIGDLQLDNSIRRQLNDIKRELIKA